MITYPVQTTDFINGLANKRISNTNQLKGTIVRAILEGIFK